MPTWGSREGRRVSDASKTRHKAAYGTIHGLLFVLGAVALGLAADSYHFLRTNRGFTPQHVRNEYAYTIFVAAWTVLLSFILLLSALFFRILSAVHSVYLLFTWLFWLIAAATIEGSTGNWRGGRFCQSVLSGSNCATLTATRAFAWVLFGISFIAFFVSIWLSATEDYDEPAPAVQHMTNVPSNPDTAPASHPSQTVASPSAATV